MPSKRCSPREQAHFELTPEQLREHARAIMSIADEAERAKLSPLHLLAEPNPT